MQLLEYTKAGKQFWGLYLNNVTIQQAFKFKKLKPLLEKGIYFSKDLYMSVGGIGKIQKNAFKELTKRLSLRLDSQKPINGLSSKFRQI